MSGAARNLATTAGSQFNIVNVSAKRNDSKRQRISQFRCNIVPGADSRSDLQSVRRENVTQLAIRIFNESNAGGAVRIVLDPDNLRRNTTLAPFEIDFAIFLLVTAADVP